MPKNEIFDSEEAQDFIENGGVSHNTKLARDRAISHFTEFIKSNIAREEENEFWQDISKIEPLLIQYFASYRVKNNELPKRNTIEGAKSFVKTMILNRSQSKINISNESQFPKFNRAWKGILLKLKKNGKLDTTHHDTLTDDELEKMYNLLEVLFNLMKLNKNDKDFNYYHSKIPKEYQDFTTTSKSNQEKIYY